MKAKSLIAFQLLFAAVFSSYVFASSVTVISDGVQLSYDQPVRLDTVVADTIKHVNPSLQSFPVANQLFNLNKQQQADELKQNTLYELNKLKHSSDKEVRLFAYNVSHQVQNWDVGYREFINLDHDWVRITPKDNPMLSGRFELSSQQKPKSIELIGMFDSPKHIPFNTELKLVDILENQSKHAGANNSFVWLINPDGHYQRYGYAYWNYENAPIIPGSVIYLGVHSSHEKLKQIEQQIIQLISMRRGKK